MLEKFLNQNQIENIISLVIDAGEIALQKQKSRDFTVTKKSDKSEVTSVDIQLSKLIYEKLNQEFPQIKIVCEEGNVRDFEEEMFWLIDPIDGTSSFISGSDEFAINIALIKNKKPIFGLIHAPIFEGGKFIFSDEKNNIVISDKANNRKLLKQSKEEIKNLKIVTSKKTQDHEIAEFLQQIHPNFVNDFSVKKISSAVKFFPLLEGGADFLLALRNTMEWDTAAGHAIVDLIGGKLKSLTMQNSSYLIGDDLSYKKPNFKNPLFISFVNKF